MYVLSFYGKLSEWAFVRSEVGPIRLSVVLDQWLSSVHFKTVSMPLGKALCSPTLSLRIFPNVAFETVPMFVSVTDDGPFSSFQGRSPSASSFKRLSTPSDRWCDVPGFVPAGSVSPQSSQYFRSSAEKQAICEGCFARQSICSVVSLH